DMGAGSYYIIGTVASGNGVDTCTKKSDTETFTDPAALSLTLKSTDISCNGAGDGIIALDDTATNSSFDSYKLYKVGENGGDDTEVGSVSPDATTGVFKSAMGAGSYYIIGTVASGNGVDTCTKKSDTETFTDPAALSLTISPSDETCAGDDGAIDLSGSNNSAFDSYQLYRVVGKPDFDEDPSDSGTDTEVGSSVTDASSGFTVVPGSYYLVGTVDSGNQPGTNCTATSNVATVNGPTNCNQLFPTQTDCNAFQNCDRSKFVQTYLCVAVKKGNKNGPIQIANVTPGAYFYYGNFDPVKNSDGKYVVTLKQETPLGFPAFRYFNNANVNIFTKECGNVQINKVTIDDKVPGLYKIIVEYTPATLAPHVIGVKFDSKSIIGFETTKSAANGAEYSFGLEINGIEEGPSFGTLYLDSSNGCTDAAVPPSNNCESESSSSELTLQSESLSKESIATDQSMELTTKSLEQGFSVAPVPFTDQVTVRYEFEYTSDVKIQFFDLNGSLLRTYADKQVTSGDETQINIDFALKANQVYIIRVETDRDAFSKNVMSGN
ncbi:hypothetical protein, partial [Christiangramia sabulilitoris]|uniref:hypothetical protein n=1 Tax=Christiangramia sabulilitoris TaxID=2583991 RepID=UPI001AA0A774